MRLLVPAAVLLLFVSLLEAVSPVPRELSLVDEYRNTNVLDLSADGSRMLIYARGRITIFDLNEKRKIASWKTAGWPEVAWFAGTDDSVYYHDSLNSLPRYLNVENPKAIKVCTRRGLFEPVDDRFAFGFGWARDNPPFLKISLKDCSIIEEADLGLAKGVWAGGPAVWLSTDRFACLTSRWVDGVTVQLPEETELWVRDLANFEVAAVVEDEEGWQFNSITFTPDGSQLFVRACKWDLSVPSDERTCRFLVMDSSSGAVVRTLDLPDAHSGLVLSPDGNLIASATRETELRKGKQYVRMRVKLYDFHSGQELAWGDLPWRKEPRLTFLNFSPDGTKLYASSKHTRVWEIPDTLLDRNVSRATPTDSSPPPAVAGSPTPQQSALVTDKEEVNEGDQCYVYAIDPERGREWYEALDLAEFQTLPEEQQKALASQFEKHFEPFWPEIAEEELTTKHYPLPFGEGKITASVYYTDESTAVRVGDRSAVLETMMLCVALGEEEYANACDAEGGAVAETAAGYALKNRIMTRAELNGRKYVIGMVCERPSAIESMMNEAQAAP